MGSGARRHVQHADSRLRIQRRTAEQRITDKLERQEAELVRRAEREEMRKEVSEKFLGLAMDAVDDETLAMLANAEMVQHEDDTAEADAETK